MLHLKYLCLINYCPEDECPKLNLKYCYLNRDRSGDPFPKLLDYAYNDAQGGVALKLSLACPTPPPSPVGLSLTKRLVSELSLASSTGRAQPLLITNGDAA
jgi:hypothetical protein